MCVEGEGVLLCLEAGRMQAPHAIHTGTFSCRGGRGGGGGAWTPPNPRLTDPLKTHRNGPEVSRPPFQKTCNEKVHGGVGVVRNGSQKAWGRGGGGVWHKALVVGSVSLWPRLLASRP